MRPRRPAASPLYPQIRFACSDHPITVWAGAILLRLYLELIGLRAALAPLLLSFVKPSNNQIPASVPYAAELVTRMCAGRADSENRIKELKEDLSLDTFCLQSFDATDAAFRTGCVLYNLLMGFRETMLPSCWFERRLRAVRDRVFLVGADLIPAARRLRVRFAVPTEERTEFLHRLRTLSAGLPIAAQLDWDFSEAADTPQSPPERTDTPVRALRFTPHAHGASPLIVIQLRNPGSI